MAPSIAPHTPGLFDRPYPDGFAYRADVLEQDEEIALVAAIQRRVGFSNFEMRGVVARRRVAFYGNTYDGTAASAMPDFLLPLRARLAQWAGVDDAAFAMALINEYQAGAPIGWHRDAPRYDIVAGVSLVSACRLRFRPYIRPGDVRTGTRRQTTHEVVLAPRSAYLITGPSRRNYEHHIPAVTELRYSITFRTLRHGGSPS